MAIKFETVKAGDTLYDVHSSGKRGMANKRVGCWEIKVVSVDHITRTAVIVRNGRTMTRGATQIERLRRSPPKAKAKG